MASSMQVRKIKFESPLRRLPGIMPGSLQYLEDHEKAYLPAFSAALAPATLPKVRLIWIDVPLAGYTVS